MIMQLAVGAHTGAVCAECETYLQSADHTEQKI